MDTKAFRPFPTSLKKVSVSKMGTWKIFHNMESDTGMRENAYTMFLLRKFRLEEQNLKFSVVTLRRDIKNIAISMYHQPQFS